MGIGGLFLAGWLLFVLTPVALANTPQIEQEIPLGEQIQVRPTLVHPTLSNRIQFDKISPTPFYQIPFQEKLSSLGVEITTNPPEGGILALHLPNVYILPNSPFYFLKQLWEGAQIILAAEEEQRGEVLLNLAEKRLAETVELIKRGDWAEAVTTLHWYEGQFSQARSVLSSITDDQDREKLRQLLTEHVQIQGIFYSFVQQIGVAELLSQVEFMKPRVSGSLELRPL